MSDKQRHFLVVIELFCKEHAGRNWPSFSDLGAVGIYKVATKIPDEVLPDDWEKAANEFLAHVLHLRYDDMFRPEWFPLGLIDYRPFRFKEEWAALGYDEVSS